MNYECDANLIERETEFWNQIVDSFEERFGKIIHVFRDLPDFRILQLKPYQGRFVIGFGAAFDIHSTDLNQLVHIQGEGMGHGQRRE